MSGAHSPFVEASLRIGSNELPAMLFDWVFSGRLREKYQLAEAVPHAWSSAHLPFAALGYRTWTELFGMAGYTEDGSVAHRREGLVTVYRAAEPRYVHRLAWTGSRDVAERFLEINAARYGVKQRHIYTLTVPPERILARISSRGEDEVIVDSRGLSARRLADGGN